MYLSFISTLESQRQRLADRNNNECNAASYVVSHFCFLYLVRSQLKRLSISLFALPLMAMFAFSLFVCVGRAGCTASEWIAASMVLPSVVVILFMPVALLLAITLWFLVRFRLTAAWHFLLSGAIVGSVFGLPFFWRSLIDPRLDWSDRLAQLAGVWGPAATTSAVMGVIWLAAIWRNQDFSR
jgi:hypothetical protein